MQTVSASFFFLLSGVSIYAALVCGAKGVQAYRTPVELDGVMHTPVVGISLYAVLAIICLFFSVVCVRRGCQRLDQPDETEERSTGDEW